MKNPNSGQEMTQAKFFTFSLYSNTIVHRKGNFVAEGIKGHPEHLLSLGITVKQNFRSLGP